MSRLPECLELMANANVDVMILGRLLENVLRVLVIAHEKVRLVARQAVIPGDDVGGDLLVCRA